MRNIYAPLGRVIAQQEQPFAAGGGIWGTDMRNFRKAMVAAAVAAAMTGSQALAADVSLAPGKPAGVHQAQNGSPSLLLIGIAAAVVVAAVVVATQSSDNVACGAACSTPVTTSTSA
jgi:hypothetical protein